MTEWGLTEIVGRYMPVEVTGWPMVPDRGRAQCPFCADGVLELALGAWQIWECRVCQTGGDAFRFVMRIEGVPFHVALGMVTRWHEADAAAVRP